MPSTTPCTNNSPFWPSGQCQGGVSSVSFEKQLQGLEDHLGQGTNLALEKNSYPRLYRCNVSVTMGNAKGNCFIWEWQLFAGVTTTDNHISNSVLYFQRVLNRRACSI